MSRCSNRTYLLGAVRTSARVGCAKILEGRRSEEPITNQGTVLNQCFDPTTTTITLLLFPVYFGSVFTTTPTTRIIKVYLHKATMKLTEIKKLKVPELRSRLKELGLDSKGLKTELVGRLWSAFEARQTEEDAEERRKLQSDSSQTPTESVVVRAPSSSPPLPPPEARITTRRQIDCTKEFADSATQTEPETALLTPQHHPAFISASVPVHQVGDGEVEMQQGGAEGPVEDRRARPQEERGRGRAFYEFKEEIRYKR